jgi:hypothetical protein
MKNYNDTIGSRARDLSVCSAVPQPTAPPRAPVFTQSMRYSYKILKKFGFPRQSFENPQTSNFMKLRQVRAEMLHEDGQTDREILRS